MALLHEGAAAAAATDARAAVALQTNATPNADALVGGVKASTKLLQSSPCTNHPPLIPPPPHPQTPPPPPNKMTDPEEKKRLLENEVQNPKPSTLNPKPQTPTPKPQTTNPTLNPPHPHPTSPLPCRRDKWRSRLAPPMCRWVIGVWGCNVGGLGM